MRIRIIHDVQSVRDRQYLSAEHPVRNISIGTDRGSHWAFTHQRIWAPNFSGVSRSLLRSSRGNFSTWLQYCGMTCSLKCWWKYRWCILHKSPYGMNAKLRCHPVLRKRVQCCRRRTTASAILLTTGVASRSEAYKMFRDCTIHKILCAHLSE